MMGHLGTALGHFIPVDFGSMVPIDNDKPKTFCASQIFGSCRSAARLNTNIMTLPKVSDVVTFSRQRFLVICVEKEVLG